MGCTPSRVETNVNSTDPKDKSADNKRTQLHQSSFQSTYQEDSKSTHDRSLRRNDTSLVDKMKLPVSKMRIEDPNELKNFLVKHPDALHGRDEDDCSTLHWACVYGLTSVAEVLINAGAGVNCRDKVGETPLHKACAWQRKDTVVFLLDRTGANIEATAQSGMTPFLWACKRGNVEIASFLIDHGCDTNVRENKRKGAMEIPLVNKEEIRDLVSNLRGSAVSRRAASRVSSSKHV
jgi:ankyrin repeat protein